METNSCGGRSKKNLFQNISLLSNKNDLENAHIYVYRSRLLFLQRVHTVCSFKVMYIFFFSSPVLLLLLLLVLLLLLLL